MQNIPQTIMNTATIIQNISKHISITNEEELHFLSLLKEKNFKSKQYILREGDVCENLSFINQGCCRTFNIDKNGYEHIINFASKDHWLGDIYSFITEKSGILFIQAMEDTEVLQLKKHDLHLLYDKIPKFERVFRILAENAYVERQKRLMEGLSLSAQERYEVFNKKYAHIKHILPQKQIALYLGVTPEFFSRMKKNHKS